MTSFRFRGQPIRIERGLSRSARGSVMAKMPSRHSAVTLSWSTSIGRVIERLGWLSWPPRLIE
jgi:hypothetical protein